MIISASYKTDIPTFYGAWFMNRLQVGYCKVLNPYNKQAFRVSLRREDVDGVIFWTKNVGPFLKWLPFIADAGYPFVIQHTITGYPRALEHSVVDAESSLRNLRGIADRFGPDVCVWRYDPVVISSITPRKFHLEQFARLAAALEGTVNEVVISFLQLYLKTQRNLDRASTEYEFRWHDPSAEEKISLVKSFVEIGASHGLQVSVCSQKEFLAEGAVEAHCVDALRLSRIAGKHFSTELRGNRKECGCYASRDIGDYDTCPHGCVYCYAVRDQELARSRFRVHDPTSDFLFEPLSIPAKDNSQPALFG